MYSQNLIYNGDFELYDSCPKLASTPGDYEIERCSGWKSPTYATSDYYNVCNNFEPGPFTGVVGVPKNNQGFQYPYSGNAYCGIVWQNYKYGDGFWVEYIQSKLLAPLKNGFEYEFTCQIVFSDAINEYAYWKFGAAFTTQAISKIDAKPFTGIIPQIMNEPNNFITDTLNWVEIKGKFFAQGGEQY